VYASTSRRFKHRFNQDCEAGSSGRGTGTDRGGKGFDDTGSGWDEKFDSDNIPVDDTDRYCQISRLVVEAGVTDRAIVVVVSIIVVMKGHRESGKHYYAYAKNRQTLEHGFK
jgi:hypothetical protein